MTEVKKVVITLAVGSFTYFLRIDRFGDGWAEGLIQNGTVMTKERAAEVMAGLRSEWRLGTREV